MSIQSNKQAVADYLRNFEIKFSKSTDSLRGEIICY